MPYSSGYDDDNSDLSWQDVQENNGVPTTLPPNLPSNWNYPNTTGILPNNGDFQNPSTFLPTNDDWLNSIFYGPQASAPYQSSPGVTGGNRIMDFLKGLTVNGGSGGANKAGGLASSLGSAAQGIANNRALQGNFTQKYDQQALADQTGRNETESDALKKLAQTSYLLDGHSGYSPASVDMNGQTRQLPDYGFGYKAPSEAQKAGATALQPQLTKRLAPGGTVSPSPLSDYAKAGGLENALNIGAGSTSIIGNIMNMFNKSDPSTDTMTIKDFMNLMNQGQK